MTLPEVQTNSMLRTVQINLPTKSPSSASLRRWTFKNIKPSIWGVGRFKLPEMMVGGLKLTWLLLFLLICSCGKKSGDHLFTLMPVSYTHLRAHETRHDL